MKLGLRKILIFGRDAELPALADCPRDVLRKLANLYEQENRSRNRLAVTQAVQLFTLVLTLLLAASLEWFVESSVLRRILIPAILVVWVVGAGLLGNRTTRLVNADFIRFVHDYCPNGRPRFCVKCDYDLRASPGNTCPECGEGVPQWTEGKQA